MSLTINKNNDNNINKAYGVILMEEWAYMTKIKHFYYSVNDLI